jgi:signal transduction histidine kinase/FixJ family two-component response regulator
MSDSEHKRILVVSGDYGIVQEVRKALSSNGFAIHTAYSHRDGMYSIETGNFDAIVVDASMTDRHSGESSAAAFGRLHMPIPIIALTASPNLPANVTASMANESGILRSLSSALGLPLIKTGPFASAKVEANSRQDEEIEALFDLSKSLTEVLELSEVLNRVVEAARRLTNAEEGMILLPDDDGGQLYLRAKVGIDVEVARNFRVKTEDTLAGRVYASGQPVLIGAQGPQKVKTEYLVNALLYVPIIYEGTCIGVLGVNNKNTEAIFHPRHQELLMNLASFAAIAIENARIHEETLERTRELQTLIDAGNVLNSSLSLGETLPNICEQLMRVLNVNLSEILQWDRGSNQLQTLARCFRIAWPSGQGPVVSLSARPTIRRALETNRPLAIRNNSDLDASEEAYLNEIGVDTIQVIPIFGGDQPLGVVQTYYIHSPERLPKTEQLQRVQHMTLEVLVTVSNNQNSQSQMQSVFRVVDEIIRMTEADWCEVSLLTPDRSILSINLAVGKCVWLEGPQPYHDLNYFTDLADAIQSQSLIDKQSDSGVMTPGVRALLDKSNTRAILGLPLIQRGQPQGMVLFADTRRNRLFSQRDIDMGRAVVGQAATALENASLVHDLEQSLINLHDTQDRLVQTARLSAMGELAAAVAHQINNPLTTIMVDSEMILMDESPDSRNYRSMQAISRAGKRAAGVARRLLAIARPNDPEAPPERIDVVDTIEGVLSLVKSHIERDHIQIIAEMPQQKLPPVMAVPGQLDDIWLNLLLNAHDALIGREGAQMGIAAEYKPDESIIEVIAWDNGPGIPTRIIDDVFKPFFTTKPVGEGTGLGLHICRQTAERIGGSITVQSVPNEGTQFFVQLPVRGGA